MTLITVSCHTSQEVLFSKIVPLETIQTKIPLGNRTNFANIDNKLFIIVLEKNKKLVKLDFITQNIEKEINIEIYPNQQIYSFQWLNDDSIFVHFIANDHPKKYHDSVLFLFSTSKAPQVLNISQVPLRSSTCVTDSCYYSKKFNELYYNGSIYFNLFALNTCPGQPSYFQRKPILGGHLELNTSKFISHPFWIPQVPLGTQYDLIHDEHFQNIWGDKLLYSFAHNHTIIEYNLTNKHAKEITISKLSLIDTIEPLTKFFSNCKEKPYSEGNQAYFYGLNVYQNCIIRSASLKPMSQKSYELNNPTRIFGIFDEKYRKKHEFVSNDFFLVRPIGENWLLRKMNPTSGFLEFIIAKLEPYKTTVEAERKKLQAFYEEKSQQPSGWLAYNAKYKIENQRHVLYIPSSSCPSCIRYLVKYLSDNHQKWKDKGLDVILLFPDYFLQDLKKEMPEIDFSIFKQDLKEDYKNFVPSFINPKLVDFKDGKIEKETIINPSDLYLINNLVESLERSEQD